MNRFVKHLLLFSAMVAIAFIIGEIYVEKTSYKYDEIAWRARLVDEKGDSINTLFIGSSLIHAAVSDTLWGPGAFNLGLVAASTEYEYYIADTVIPRLPNLELVVIELGYQTLRDVRDFANEYQSFIGWCRPTIYFHTRKYPRLSTHGFELFNPRIFREKIFLQFNQCGHDSVNILLNPLPTLWDADQRRAQGAKIAACYTADTTYFNVNLRHLEGIIQKAQKHGAEVVLCTFPVLEEYRQHMDPDQLAEMYSTAEMLSGKYGIRYFDYLADGRFGISDFLDLSHLNHGSGRTKFTEIFRHDLLTTTSQCHTSIPSNE